MVGRLRTHALLALALASLVVGVACDPVVSADKGCSLDMDCAQGERCVARRCLLADGDAGVDAGPRPDGGEPDAGLPDSGEPDAGGGFDAGPCDPDLLDNDTPETAYEPAFNAEEGTPADGHFCPVADEYLRFFGFEGDPVDVVVLWDAPADIDVELIPPEAASGAIIGWSVHPRMEVATSVLSHTGDHVVRLYPVGNLPSGGLDYRAEIRSGLPCRTEAGCVAAPELRCVMPVWTPSSSAGQAPSGEVIFRGGMCVKPYEPCHPDNADSPFAEGVSNSRLNAIAGLPAGPAWSCQLDEDWYRYEMPINGDLTLRFSNEAPTAGTFLLSAYDVAGNMLGGVGWADLPIGQTRALLIPYLASGTVVYVRVLQLHQDDLGLYSLSAETFANQCSNVGDCARPEARSYGRTECRQGRCECPLPDACSPPS